jgi:pyruvate formate lyase activating enzyme
MTEWKSRPLISNIHRFALDDGPGIRTTVFFKGCPLSCAWCHNPESINPAEEVAFHGQLCIGCADCLKACPHGAISMDPDERINRNLCKACGVCTDACPTTALRIVGRYYAPSELLDTLLRDRLFFETSKGGVTFSGGEPTLFMDYISTVAKELRKKGIHIAIQTSGYFDIREFTDKLLPYVDLVYFDIKILDPQKHEYWTGKDNNRILKNFIQLARSPEISIVPRILLVPGITATEENLSNLALFLRDSHATNCELLSYNSGGMLKRAFLGKPLPESLTGVRPDMEAEERCRKFFCKILANGDEKSLRVKNPLTHSRDTTDVNNF